MLYKRTWLYLTIMLSLTGANIFAVVSSADQTSLLYPAIWIKTINIGGLSIEAARNAITASNVLPFLDTALEVKYADRHWALNAKDINLTLDDAQTAQLAFTQPRQGHMLQRFVALHKTHYIHPVVRLDVDKLDAWLQEIAKEINKPAVAASVLANESTITITPEAEGYELDLINSAHAITHAVITGQSAVNLIVRPILPALTVADLKHINGILSSYDTKFDASEAARSHNITLAAKALNATLIKPNETISFNAIVGPRTQQRGYLKAPAFAFSETLVEDWGGGICQVSSTLYNAALLANLEIVERSAHYRPVGYVPIGLDATVDFASNLDLKIKNTLSHPVYITSEIIDNTVRIRLLGLVDPHRPEIELATTKLTAIEPKIIIIQDTNLNPGEQIVVQEGQSGFAVSTARIRRFNNHEQHEHLADDIYKPLDKVVRVGAKIPSMQK